MLSERNFKMSGKFRQKKSLVKKSKFLTRKDQRKQLRKEKKAKKNDYYRNKKQQLLTKNSAGGLKKGKFQDQSSFESEKKFNKTELANKTSNVSDQKLVVKKQVNFLDEQNKKHKQEVREKVKLEKSMKKMRKRMLLTANEEEDKEIKKLEKHLKLNKRKSKTIPKSFAEDGLDYLLEICDSDKLREVASADMNLQESGSEFEDDFALITGKTKRKVKTKEKCVKKIKQDSIKADNLENDTELPPEDSSYNSDEGEDEFESESEDVDINDVKQCEEFNQESDEEDEVGSSSGDNQEETNDSDNDEINSELSCDKESEMEQEINENRKKTIEEMKTDGTWEDIYGRLRDKKGNLVVVPNEGKNKYVPPHLRAKKMGEAAKNSEAVVRLNKQLKGLINRLAESNMHSIASQIDELYMRNSRNDMNDSLLSLIMEALVSRVLTGERLVMEHAMLITILHANVGMEVGAHFLQCFVQKFDTMFEEGQEVENKELDNVLLILCHMYNFKVFHSILIYDILKKLTEKFTEKEVELILLVLRSIGFSLRKDDPLALKNLVLTLQKKSSESSHLKDNTRVRFMLDILLAVKNNNMTKIPQYDHSHSEHLKKLLKSMIHKGKYVTELKITLEDLLKAEERGRWWIVGSAWSGAPTAPPATQSTAPTTAGGQYSQEVLELARKQRMNTDTRRNIFCILMTAEDYLDAFEKLLRLGLKAQQEQEIIHVLVHCLLQEKKFNPYYAHLVTHFCQADRKHQMTIQYHLWDKFKELSKLSKSKISNLAKFLSHLFLEKALPISVLKVMQFSEMDKPCVRLLRQVLLSLLLSESSEALMGVFSRVSRPERLHMFRESLRLFMHHFVLKNASELPPDQALLIKQRVKLAESALTTEDTTKKYL